MSNRGGKKSVVVCCCCRRPESYRAQFLTDFKFQTHFRILFINNNNFKNNLDKFRGNEYNWVYEETFVICLMKYLR